MYFEDKCDREVFSQNLQPFPSFLPTENWFTEYEWVMRYWEGAQEGKTREYMWEKNTESLFSPPLYVTKKLLDSLGFKQGFKQVLLFKSFLDLLLI